MLFSLLKCYLDNDTALKVSQCVYCFTTSVSHGVENYFPRLWGMGISDTIFLHVTAAVMLLMVSSAVTLAVPYSIGRVIDIIYSYITQENMVQKLREFSLILLVVFIIGGLANFGRVYLMHTASEFHELFLYDLIIGGFNKDIDQ